VFHNVLDKRLSEKGSSFAAIGVAGFFLVWALGLAGRPAYHVVTNWNNPGKALQTAKVSGFRVSPEEHRAISDLAEYVNEFTAHDDRIFIGLTRHDVIIANDIMAYFLLARPSATRYHELHPAVTDTAGIQKEIIDDLDRKRVEVIILRTFFSSDHLERAKAEFSKNLPLIGATDLDQFIRDNYQPVTTFGPYTVWKRHEKRAAFSPVLG
jgi:hypothetical protein